MCLFSYVFWIVDFLTTDLDLTCCHWMCLLNAGTGVEGHYLHAWFRINVILHYYFNISYNNKLEMGQHYPLISVSLMLAFMLLLYVTRARFEFTWNIVLIQKLLDYWTSNLNRMETFPFPPHNGYVWNEFHAWFTIEWILIAIPMFYTAFWNIDEILILFNLLQVRFIKLLVKQFWNFHSIHQSVESWIEIKIHSENLFPLNYELYERKS